MSDTNVAIRLKLFIEHKDLSYSQFADECGIPRPSLSQLLTGRNKKISDILVGQIHSAYPDLNILWLLFDEGQMLVSDPGSESSPTPAPSIEQPRLRLSNAYGSFTPDSDAIGASSHPEEPRSGLEPNIFSTSQSSAAEFGKETALSSPDIESKHKENELIEANLKIRTLTAKIEKMKQNPRRVTQIMVYYDDSTFETFIPGSPTR